MKFNTILTLVVATLACKGTADCFASEYNQPCCEKTTNALISNNYGIWSIEKGVICGIEPATNLRKRSNGNGKGNGNGSGNGKVKRNGKRICKPKPSYMDKVHIEEICPADLLQLRENVTYPEPFKVHYYSTTTQSERPLNIVLPPNYDPKKKYPVFYYLHGIGCNEDTMLEEPLGAVPIYTNLVNDHRAKEMIIVVPYQYAPAPGTEVSEDLMLTPEYFEGYDNFINDLVNDIMPYMKKNYRIATGRENTAIAGFSMGGRNALYIGFKRSDLFGYVGAFSPAPGIFETTDQFSYHKGLFKPEELVANPSPILTMLSCGTSDFVVGDYPEQYHNALVANKQKHIWYTIEGANHDNTAIVSGYYNFISSIFNILN